MILEREEGREERGREGRGGGGRERERERERERVIDVRVTPIGCLLYGPQPGIEPAIFWVMDDAPTN